ncbi:MAG TPA: hypothetical protein VME43_09240 [Bryobacteraceae bacterium]|nr:hypothetical protein [Bryobacteraceae bacterium]
MQEHVYMAGPWLGEQRIPNSLTLRLDGVLSSGRESMADHADEFVVFKGGVANPSLSCLEIRLPRPKCITSTLFQGLANNAITFAPGSVSLLGPPAKMTQCCVFEYAVSPKDQFVPRLTLIGGPTLGTDPQWIAGQNPTTGSGAYSLHVYAEADAVENSPDHPAMVFYLAAGILGAAAQLRPAQTKPQAASSLPANLAPEEATYTLESRIEQMRSLTAATDHKPFSEIKRFTLPKLHVLNDLFTCGNIVMIGA